MGKGSLSVFVFIQLLAVLAITAVSAAVGGMALWLWGLGQGGVAWGLATAFALRPSWRLINAGFVPLLLLINGLALPAWLYLAACIGLWLISRNAIDTHVPLVRSRQVVIQALSELLRPHTKGRFIDLGCGIGSVLKPLARAHPELDFVGVENAPLTYLIAKWRTRHLPNCSIYYQSIWQHRLEPYQWVYCYLSPTPMTAIWRKACEQMQPDAWLISNQMPIKNLAPQHTHKLANGLDELLFWQPAQVVESR